MRKNALRIICFTLTIALIMSILTLNIAVVTATGDANDSSTYQEWTGTTLTNLASYGTTEYSLLDSNGIRTISPILGRAQNQFCLFDNTGFNVAVAGTYQMVFTISSDSNTQIQYESSPAFLIGTRVGGVDSFAYPAILSDANYHKYAMNFTTTANNTIVNPSVIFQNRMEIKISAIGIYGLAYVISEAPQASSDITKYNEWSGTGLTNLASYGTTEYTLANSNGMRTVSPILGKAQNQQCLIDDIGYTVATAGTYKMSFTVSSDSTTTIQYGTSSPFRLNVRIDGVDNISDPTITSDNKMRNYTVTFTTTANNVLVKPGVIFQNVMQIKILKIGIYGMAFAVSDLPGTSTDSSTYQEWTGTDLTNLASYGTTEYTLSNSNGIRTISPILGKAQNQFCLFDNTGYTIAVAGTYKMSFSIFSDNTTTIQYATSQPFRLDARIGGTDYLSDPAITSDGIYHKYTMTVTTTSNNTVVNPGLIFQNRMQVKISKIGLYGAACNKEPTNTFIVSTDSIYKIIVNSSNTPALANLKWKIDNGFETKTLIARQGTYQLVLGYRFLKAGTHTLTFTENGAVPLELGAGITIEAVQSNMYEPEQLTSAKNWMDTLYSNTNGGWLEAEGWVDLWTHCQYLKEKTGYMSWAGTTDFQTQTQTTIDGLLMEKMLQPVGTTLDFDVWGDNSGTTVRFSLYSSATSSFVYYNLTLNYSGWRHYSLKLDGTNGLLKYPTNKTYKEILSSTDIFQINGSWNNIASTFYVDNVKIRPNSYAPIPTLTYDIELGNSRLGTWGSSSIVLTPNSTTQRVDGTPSLKVKVLSTFALVNMSFSAKDLYTSGYAHTVYKGSTGQFEVSQAEPDMLQGVYELWRGQAGFINEALDYYKYSNYDVKYLNAALKVGNTTVSHWPTQTTTGLTYPIYRYTNNNNVDVPRVECLSNIVVAFANLYLATNDVKWKNYAIQQGAGVLLGQNMNVNSPGYGLFSCRIYSNGTVDNWWMSNAYSEGVRALAKLYQITGDATYTTRLNAAMVGLSHSWSDDYGWGDINPTTGVPNFITTVGHDTYRSGRISQSLFLASLVNNNNLSYNEWAERVLYYVWGRNKLNKNLQNLVGGYSYNYNYLSVSNVETSSEVVLGQLSRYLYNNGIGY